MTRRRELLIKVPCVPKDAQGNGARWLLVPEPDGQKTLSIFGSVAGSKVRTKSTPTTDFLRVSIRVGIIRMVPQFESVADLPLATL